MSVCESVWCSQRKRIHSRNRCYSKRMFFFLREKRWKETYHFNQFSKTKKIKKFSSWIIKVSIRKRKEENKSEFYTFMNEMCCVCLMYLNIPASESLHSKRTYDFRDENYRVRCQLQSIRICARLVLNALTTNSIGM